MDPGKLRPWVELARDTALSVAGVVLLTHESDKIYPSEARLTVYVVMMFGPGILRYWRRPNGNGNSNGK